MNLNLNIMKNSTTKLHLEELAMLENAHNTITNLFDMGYSYDSSIDIIADLETDIEDLYFTIYF